MNCYQCFIFQTGSSKINHRPGPCLQILQHPSGSRLSRRSRRMVREPFFIRSEGIKFKAEEIFLRKAPPRKAQREAGLVFLRFCSIHFYHFYIPIPKRNAVANNSSMGNSGPQNRGTVHLYYIKLYICIWIISWLPPFTQKSSRLSQKMGTLKSWAPDAWVTPTNQPPLMAIK